MNRHPCYFFVMTSHRSSAETGDPVVELGENLAENLRYLRARRHMTQARLAKLCGVPRSTLANLETGAGNPTLAVLGRLAAALQISITELLSAPVAMGRLYPSAVIPKQRRGSPRNAVIHKLLPDPLPGMEIDRMQIPRGTRLVGVPHRPGTREYLYCEKGTVTLTTAGERYELEAGDVLVFRGDLAHSYHNHGRGEAILLGVVTLAPG